MATAVAMAAGIVGMSHAHAQSTPAPGNTTGNTVGSRVRPEIQVVVAPMLGGQWGVSEVYSTQVPAAKAKERLARLLKVSGWTAASPVSFEDEALDIGSVGKIGAGAPPPIVMSSVRCALNGLVVDPAQGTISITPFLESLRDLNAVNVVFLGPFPVNTVYHGVQHLDNSQVTVNLTGTQGTYLFVANIKDHGTTPLSLIRDEPVVRKGTRAIGGMGGSVLPFLFGLAAAVGLLVYYLATRFVAGGVRKS